MLPTTEQAKEWLTTLFASWTFPGVWVLSGALLLAAIFALTLMEYHSRKKPKLRKYLFLPKLLSFATICLAGYSLLASITALQTANAHGADKPYAYNMLQLWDCIKHSPEEETVPDKKTGTILLYYRFGCSDCEAIFTELQQETNQYDNIYWVSSRSTQGKELRKDYPVTTVPTGVYIRSNEMPLSLTLHRETMDGTVQLNTENLQILLHAMENGI